MDKRDGKISQAKIKFTCLKNVRNILEKKRSFDVNSELVFFSSI